MRLAVCGYGQSGKDTVGLYVASITGLRMLKSTSEASADVVFKKWGHKLYRDAKSCWGDRRSWRDTWARTIWDYNKPDGLTLYREMVNDGNDILVGIRNRDELAACVSAGLVTCSLWVRRDSASESQGSMTISEEDCDFTVHNNGTIEQLHRKLAAIFSMAPKQYVNG